MQAMSQLIAEWNQVTDPTAFRTDDEHDVCKARAREIDAELKRRDFRLGRDWKEYSNGMRWPIYRTLTGDDGMKYYAEA